MKRILFLLLLLSSSYSFAQSRLLVTDKITVNDTFTIKGKRVGGIDDSTLTNSKLKIPASKAVIDYVKSKTNDSVIVKTRFDTATRLMTYYLLNGDSAKLLIPGGGAGGGGGVSGISNSVTTNDVTLTLSNGATTTFNKADARMSDADVAHFILAYSWGNHAGLYPTVQRFTDSIALLRSLATAGNTLQSVLSNGANTSIAPTFGSGITFGSGNLPAGSNGIQKINNAPGFVADNGRVYTLDYNKPGGVLALMSDLNNLTTTNTTQTITAQKTFSGGLNFLKNSIPIPLSNVGASVLVLDTVTNQVQRVAVNSITGAYVSKAVDDTITSKKYFQNSSWGHVMGASYYIGPASGVSNFFIGSNYNPVASNPYTGSVQVSTKRASLLIANNQQLYFGMKEGVNGANFNPSDTSTTALLADGEVGTFIGGWGLTTKAPYGMPNYTNTYTWRFGGYYGANNDSVGIHITKNGGFTKTFFMPTTQGLRAGTYGLGGGGGSISLAVDKTIGGDGTTANPLKVNVDSLPLFTLRNSQADEGTSLMWNKSESESVIKKIDIVGATKVIDNDSTLRFAVTGGGTNPVKLANRTEAAWRSNTTNDIMFDAIITPLMLGDSLNEFTVIGYMKPQGGSYRRFTFTYDGVQFLQTDAFPSGTADVYFRFELQIYRTGSLTRKLIWYSEALKTGGEANINVAGLSDNHLVLTAFDGAFNVGGITVKSYNLKAY
jgi:hypothetical protein